MKNKAPTKRMILFFHNILNKVTSSTLTWVQKTLAASIRPRHTARFKHSGYKWPYVLCTVARQIWGNVSWKKRPKKYLNVVCFSLSVWRGMITVSLSDFGGHVGFKLYKNNVIIKMEKPKKLYPLRPCWKGRHYQD